MVKYFQLIVLFLLMIGCDNKQSFPVRLHYEETESPASIQKIKLSGELQGLVYKIRMVHYRDGVVSYKILNEEPSVIKDTVLSIRIEAEPLHAHEVRFTIEGEKIIEERVEVEDVLHSILLETYSAVPYFSKDTISLIGYTSGALYETMVDGELRQGGSYCDVRNAKLPPKEWYNVFDMKEYIWFDLIIE